MKDTINAGEQIPDVWYDKPSKRKFSQFWLNQKIADRESIEERELCDCGKCKWCLEYLENCMD